MALETIEDVSLVLSFDAVCLAKSTSTLTKMYTESPSRRNNFERTEPNCAQHSPTDHEGALLTVITKPTILIYGRGKHINLILIFR